MALPAFCATRLAPDDPLVALATELIGSRSRASTALLTDPAQCDLVLTAVRSRFGYSAALADVERRATRGVRIFGGNWVTPAGVQKLGPHYDDMHGESHITLVVYPCAPGCAPWTGGELLVTDAATSDAAAMRPLSTAPTAGGRVRAVAMLGTTWHCPLPSTTGTRCCVTFHVGI